MGTPKKTAAKKPERAVAQKPAPIGKEIATPKRTRDDMSDMSQVTTGHTKTESDAVMACYKKWRKQFLIVKWGDRAMAAADMWVAEMCTGICQKNATERVASHFNMQRCSHTDQGGHQATSTGAVPPGQDNENSEKKKRARKKSPMSDEERANVKARAVDYSQNTTAKKLEGETWNKFVSRRAKELHIEWPEGRECHFAVCSIEYKR